jgi:hypothetical protein
MLKWNLNENVIDGETTFLHGDIKEANYMGIIQAKKDEYLILKRTTYHSV